jgi:hypothetical protein
MLGWFSAARIRASRVEARQARRVERESRRHDLERHVTVQAMVAGPIHLAHAARPQRGDHLVGADAVTGCQEHVVTVSSRSPTTSSSVGTTMLRRDVEADRSRGDDLESIVHGTSPGQRLRGMAARNDGRWQARAARSAAMPSPDVRAATSLRTDQKTRHMTDDRYTAPGARRHPTPAPFTRTMTAVAAVARRGSAPPPGLHTSTSHPSIRPWNGSARRGCPAGPSRPAR